MLAVQEALHPVYSNLIEVHSEMEQQDLAYLRLLKRHKARKARREGSQEAIENKRSGESPRN
jgi:hypothetical protein